MNTQIEEGRGGWYIGFVDGKLGKRIRFEMYIKICPKKVSFMTSKILLFLVHDWASARQY